jgi:hypothetical protein
MGKLAPSLRVNLKLGEKRYTVKAMGCGLDEAGARALQDFVNKSRVAIQLKTLFLAQERPRFARSYFPSSNHLFQL